MVSGRESAVRPADLASRVLQALKGLRRGDLMDEMTVCNCLSAGLFSTRLASQNYEPMKMRRVPSSFSSTMCACSTLS